MIIINNYVNNNTNAHRDPRHSAQLPPCIQVHPHPWPPLLPPDILYVLEDRLTMSNVLVIHPGGATYRRSAAQCPGAAATHHNTAKYRRREDASCAFLPTYIRHIYMAALAPRSWTSSDALVAKQQSVVVLHFLVPSLCLGFLES
jgi:hypothetical protein